MEFEEFDQDPIAARLWVSQSLSEDQTVTLDRDQAHYLRNVLRLETGTALSVFNGRDGEWRARVETLSKTSGTLRALSLSRAQSEEIDIWLIFAPIKRARLEITIEKAVELGVGSLQPVITRRAIVSRLNMERLQAHAREAAEQTERLSVPEIRQIIPLDDLLSRWPTERSLLLCDESGTATPLAEVLAGSLPCSNRWAVLIGPEGGFDRSELDLLKTFPFVIPVGLGPRILRADTAALAALAVFQSLRGDWTISRNRSGQHP